MYSGPLEKINDYKFRIPKSYKPGMRVDGVIYSSEKLLAAVKQDNSLEQVVNVAHLPGIVKNSLAMPDIHWGYGFCIGGVAATDPESGGVISPGGVGYDINCGVRMLKTNLKINDLRGRLENLVNVLYNTIPSGVGSKGEIQLSGRSQKNILIQGAGWAVSQGLGVKEDLECCEENGAIEGADPDSISERAYARGRQQAGTLGSGNHFIEVQVVEEILDAPAAESLNLFPGQITVMIHSGSRGFGYQVCDDSLRVMVKAAVKYDLNLPDKQLACTPLSSPEARQYLGAMRAAANYAWANRQVLAQLVRRSFEKVFSQNWPTLGLDLIYDVAHNIAKIESHSVDGEIKTLCVHRKGATRSLGPDNPQLPDKYRQLGQPVIIPGDMGSSSYLLLGTKQAEAETFSSTCHGAGRVKSRHAALRSVDFAHLMQELKDKGIEVRAAGKRTVVEEAPSAYKNIDDVIRVVHTAGLSRKVGRMRPLCVIKG